MNRTELFDEVKNWLEAKKLSYAAENEKTLRFRVNCDNGIFDVDLLCEEKPAILQASCPVPVRIPKEKALEIGLILHNINTCLRIGAFHLYVEGRVIEFRLTMPIRTEADLPEQFNQAVATTLSTMDDHVRTLGLLACDTPEARQAIAKLSPATQAAGVITRLSNERFELN